MKTDSLQSASWVNVSFLDVNGNIFETYVQLKKNVI